MKKPNLVKVPHWYSKMWKYISFFVFKTYTAVRVFSSNITLDFMFLLQNIAKQTTLESVQTTNSQKSLLWD